MSVNVRLVSSTEVGSRRSSPSRRSGGWDSSAETTSIVPIAHTARASALRTTDARLMTPLYY